MKERRSRKPKTRTPAGPQPRSQLDLSHLRRDARTALELAIVALAPADLIDRLASAAGLLEAISELPQDSAPALALAPKAAARAKSALEEWHEYDQRHVPKALA
jgi:hypothetical protein